MEALTRKKQFLSRYIDFYNRNIAVYLYGSEVIIFILIIIIIIMD